MPLAKIGGFEFRNRGATTYWDFVVGESSRFGESAGNCWTEVRWDSSRNNSCGEEQVPLVVPTWPGGVRVGGVYSDL